jgi:hypothetical protein
MNTYFFLLSFLLQWQLAKPLEQPAMDVDISGTWTGITTQNEGGYSSSYNISLFLKNENGKITGTSVLSIDDIFAKIEVEGTFQHGLSLVLKDVAITENKVVDNVNMEWCMKNYILLLKKENNQWHMEGHWHGKTSFGDCTPGKVFLKRGVERV